jgi:hypothetical protein
MRAGTRRITVARMTITDSGRGALVGAAAFLVPTLVVPMF